MTPTLEARLAEALPCMYEDADVGSRACDEDSSFGLCERCIARPAILALTRKREREERERCASQWREVYEIPMRDRIHALEDRND